MGESLDRLARRRVQVVDGERLDLARLAAPQRLEEDVHRARLEQVLAHECVAVPDRAVEVAKHEVGRTRLEATERGGTGAADVLDVQLVERRTGEGKDVELPDVR